MDRIAAIRTTSLSLFVQEKVEESPVEAIARKCASDIIADLKSQREPPTEACLKRVMGVWSHINSENSGIAKEIIRERARWMIFHDPSPQGLIRREQLERIGIPVAHGRLNTADWKNRPPEIQRFALIQEELRRRTAMRRR